MIFKSKIDWWYWAILLFLLANFGITYVFVGEALNTTGSIALLATTAFGLGLPIWLAFTTNYLVTDSELQIRSGPFRWKIDLASITDIKKSRSLLSSPALSLDRLEITYEGGRKILVSPEDHDEFCKAVQPVA